MTDMFFSDKFQIVDEQGRPTPYFLRQMLLLSETATEAAETGGVAIIRAIEVQAVSATVDFTDIPIDHKDLIISIHGRGDTAATTATVRLTINGDTGANYYSDHVNRSGSTQVAAGNYAEAGIIPAASTAAGRAGVIEIVFPDIVNTTLHKQFSYHGYYTDNVTPLGQYGGGHWESTVPVSSISLALSAGNFDVGSRVVLYGRGQ